MRGNTYSKIVIIRICDITAIKRFYSTSRYVIESYSSVFSHRDYQIAIFLGLLSYVVYCIWHESYFAINEKSTRVIILFAFIAAINIVIGIINAIHGQIIVDGRITFRILNPLCAVLFIVIFATMLLKRIANSKNASADEEEEDDE